MRSIPVRSIAVLAVVLASGFCGIHAQTSLQYQKPPQAIVDLVDTRPTPNVEVSGKDSTGTQWLLTLLTPLRASWRNSRSALAA